MPNTVTASYSLTHTAFTLAAREHDVPPYVARVAYALYERGGTATTFELYDDLSRDEGSAVRRALGQMYRQQLAKGEAWSGGPRRPGTVTLVTLSSSGAGLAQAVRTHLTALSEQMEQAA